MIARPIATKFPNAIDWLRALVESGIFTKPEPEQLVLIGPPAWADLKRMQDGTRLCGICNIRPVHAANKRCGACYAEHRKIYWRLYQAKKALTR